MRYKGMEIQSAIDLVGKFRAGENVDSAQYEIDCGAGAVYSDAELRKVAQRARKIMEGLIKEDKAPDELDVLIFDLIHSSVPRDPDLIRDHRYWTRLAVTMFYDVIVWRFPGKKKDENGERIFNVENLGVGATARKRAENYLYKLWVRGELTYEDGRPDPYSLGRHGSIDFWTSHIHRQGFPNCGNIARQLVRFQYPSELKGKPRLLDGEEDKSSNKFGMRTLIKRLRRLWATVEYTLVESQQSEKIIQEMAKGLTLANGKHFYT